MGTGTTVKVHRGPMSIVRDDCNMVRNPLMPNTLRLDSHRGLRGGGRH